MKYSVPAIAALAAAPTIVQAYNVGPSFLATPFMLESPALALLQKQRALARSMFDQPSGWSSPRYELIDNDEKFQLSVDVPGVKEENLDIQLDDGYLTVRGHREAASENSRFASKFSQTFSLDPTVDVEQFTATLNNGVLVVTAPKDMKKLEENIRRIPITAGVETPTLSESKEDENKVEIPVNTVDEDVVDLDKKEEATHAS